MKIVTDAETSFMEPMTEQALLEYAEYVVSQMDGEKAITNDGMEFITRDDNIPCEEDQDTIMALVEELYNAEENTDTETEGNIEASESDESESQEEASTEGSEEAFHPGRQSDWHKLSLLYQNRQCQLSRST